MSLSNKIMTTQEWSSLLSSESCDIVQTNRQAFLVYACVVDLIMLYQSVLVRIGLMKLGNHTRSSMSFGVLFDLPLRLWYGYSIYNQCGGWSLFMEWFVLVLAHQLIFQPWCASALHDLVRTESHLAIYYSRSLFFVRLVYWSFVSALEIFCEWFFVGPVFLLCVSVSHIRVFSEERREQIYGFSRDLLNSFSNFDSLLQDRFST